MTPPTVESVDAWEVLDSRGDPTVRVRVSTDGTDGVFTVPSGASVGAHEPIERRDGDDRYGGNGVLTAVDAIRDELGPVVTGRDPTNQAAIDADLVECDGTADLSRLGANAVLGVSGAIAHAGGAALGQPLYEYLDDGGTRTIPCPMVNVLSGGLHATGGVAIQDFLIVPAGADTYSDAIETVWDVRTAVRDRLIDRGHRPLVADEGGFSPPLSSLEAAFDLLAAGVEDAGHRPARDDVAFAVDVAASHFYDADRSVYELDRLDSPLDRGAMIDLVSEWLSEYPVVSIEDPLAEDDWEGWSQLVDRFGGDLQVLGDDLIVTEANRLQRAITTGAANAALIKINQAGTITQATDVLQRAAQNGLRTVVSARSGETCDTTIADLAVACGAGQIKIGSLARSERLTKYNRLLEIERRSDVSFAAFDGETG